MTVSNKMYLRAIGQLLQYGEGVRIVDIAGTLGVSKASASTGVKRLAGMGLVKHELYGDVQMTAAGKAKVVAMQRADDMIRLRIQGLQQKRKMIGLA